MAIHREIRVATACIGSDRDRRANLLLPVHTLIAGIHEEGQTALARGGSATVFVDRRADTEIRRCQLGDCPRRRSAEERATAAFTRVILHPVQVLLVPRETRERNRGAGRD